MQKTERDPNIDALRGISFLAVILVNLLTEFRVPFLAYLEKFHTESGLANHATDWIVGLSLDQKGFTILSFFFGVGIAMMAEQNFDRIHGILFRRFLFLLVLGFIHIVFVFSGDILTLYALSGLLLIPLARLDSRAVTSLLLVLIGMRLLIPGMSIPFGISSDVMIQQQIKYYGNAGFFDTAAFRWFELKHLIGPLLTNIWPRTLAVMVFGLLAYRKKMISYLRASKSGSSIAIAFLALGTVFTTVDAYLAFHGLTFGRWNLIVGDLGVVSLAIGYSSIVLRLNASNRLVQWMAPLGRMGLTTYLTQTVLLGLIFYGYGLDWFGKLGSFTCLILGIAFYAFQIVFSRWYLRKFQQGPIEALWRKFTYARIPF